MKSPNASTNRGSSSSRRGICAFATLLLICPIVVGGCQTTDSGLSRKSSDNPYSKYEPKTPEEEAYYRDVYSGDWREESDNGLQSVYKHSASTTMPEHWGSMPPGARTLEEIRFEASQRKMAAVRSIDRNLTTTVPPAPPVPSASSSVLSPNYTPSSSSAFPGVPAVTPSSAPLAPSYASQNSGVSSGAPTTYAQAVSNQAGSPASAQDVQFVAQNPVLSGVNTSSSEASVYPSTTQPAIYPNAQPATQTVPQPVINPTQQPASQTNPQPAVYPVGGLSASFSAFEKDELVIRGQETADESTPSSLLEISTANVHVKSVDPDAKAVGAAGVLATLRDGSKRLLLKIDPSLATAFEKFYHPSLSNNDSEKSRESYDEYIVTGGDSKNPVRSFEDWSVENLDSEDTAVHFDTIDGRILTEPSNRIFLYSPRFGAVRQVVGPVEGDYREGISIANMTTSAALEAEAVGVDVRTQEIRPLGGSNVEQPEGAETTVGVTASTGVQGVMEGDAQIRLGAMLASDSVADLSVEDASLMFEGALAAQGWSGSEGIAVSTELANAFSNAYVEGAGTVYHVQDGTKTSKLKVIKIANKDAAKPGEFVEFVLRYENIGDQPIGNVTILDNLSARLRYVDGTAESSAAAEFLADLNSNGSLVLRWEIQDPLLPKEFGVIRFICKVQ